MLDEVLIKHLFKTKVTVIIMKINKINNINFRENELSREMNSQNAILMLRDPNASIKFQQNQEIARNADSISSNPLKALGYKLYRTFNMIKNTEEPQGTQNANLDTLA